LNSKEFALIRRINIVTYNSDYVTSHVCATSCYFVGFFWVGLRKYLLNAIKFDKKKF